MFPFNEKNGFYKDLIKNRAQSFFTSEHKIDRKNTNDFFSSKCQVNPLLYAYTITENGRYRSMDAEYLLEKKYYDAFQKESFVMKGNQSSSKLWQIVTDLSAKKNTIYHEDENIDYSYTYTNSLLFDDTYTKDFLNILSNGSKYFEFSDKSIFTFYDVLLDVVFKRLYNGLEDEPELLDSIDELEKVISEHSDFVVDGVPIDQYLALNTYSSTMGDIPNKEIIEDIKKNLGPALTYYQKNYNIVFGQLFRLLKFFMSPIYNYDVESPAMNIFFMALTIASVKELYKTDKERYERLVDRLIELTDNLDDKDKVNKNNICYQFRDVFGTITKLSEELIENVLPLLIKNTTAENYDGTNSETIDRYFSETYFCEVNNSKNEDNIDTVSKAIIMMTEFFKKMDGLRYFDASTFCIDVTMFDKLGEKSKYWAKLFSESLLESCYINMNILGSEVFFNGEAPGHFMTSNLSVLCKDTFYRDTLGLDFTRVMKNNIPLINDIYYDGKLQKYNPFNSNIAMINMYTSLAYCIQITLDNLDVNPFMHGEYSDKNLRRPLSFWEITI